MRSRFGSPLLFLHAPQWLGGPIFGRKMVTGTSQVCRNDDLSNAGLASSGNGFSRVRRRPTGALYANGNRSGGGGGSRAFAGSPNGVPAYGRILVRYGQGQRA